jgi:hypothetical protein
VFYLQLKLKFPALVFLVFRANNVEQRKRRLSLVVALYIFLLDRGVGYFLDFLL